MKILITGGAGFIGSHTADALLGRGHAVRVLDNLDPQVHPGGARPAHLPPDVELVVGDVRDKDAVDAALEGVDALLHLAAAVGVGQSMYEIRHYADVNTMGTATVLEALLAHREAVRRVVVASSMSVYGEGAYQSSDGSPAYPELRDDEQLERRAWEPLDPATGETLSPLPTSESKPLQPTSVYAVTKRDQEELFLAVGRSYAIPTLALRYFNAYGPRQALSNPYTGVAAIFAARLLNGRSPVIFEDGRQTRDFVHVGDVARANVLALEAETPRHAVFNVGSGGPVSILDVATALMAALEVRVEPDVMQRYRTGDVRHCYADVTAIEAALGYRPDTGLEAGMKEMAHWLCEQSASDRVEAATSELEDRGLLR